METFIIKGNELENIFDGNDDIYSVVDSRYKFIGVDHDLWEFQAIIQRVKDNKFFKVNWFDNYACSWNECGLDEMDFKLTEVIPMEETVLTFV